MEELKFTLNVEECSSIKEFVKIIKDNIVAEDDSHKIPEAVTVMYEAVKIWERIRKWFDNIKIEDNEIPLNYRQIVLILRALFKCQKLVEDRYVDDWNGLIKELASQISDKRITNEDELNSAIAFNEDKLRESAKESFLDDICGLKIDENGSVRISLPCRNGDYDCLLSLEIEDFALFLGTNIWFLRCLERGRIEIKFARWQD